MVETKDVEYLLCLQGSTIRAVCRSGGSSPQAAGKDGGQIDKIIDWAPIEEFLEKNLGRRHNAAGNPAYPALGMFKALLLQSWYGLSDRELSDNLEDRISFSHFCGFSLDHEVPDYSTIAVFAITCIKKGWLSRSWK